MRPFALVFAAGLFAAASAVAQTTPTKPVMPLPPNPTLSPPGAKADSTPVPTAPPPMQTFRTAAAAKAACTDSPVVWGDASSNVYHMSNSRYFGKTKKGSYMCQAAADKGGYHIAKNGS